MGNILIVYYSLNGSTKFIAELIAKNIKADLLELKLEKELKTDGFSKYFWGGKQVMMKEKPKLLPLDKNPQDYDTIFIGTPVWAWNYSPPLRSLFSQMKLQNKKIALFCCHDGGPGKTLENMKKELIGNKIIGKKEFLNPSKNKGQGLEKMADWLKIIFP